MYTRKPDLQRISSENGETMGKSPERWRRLEMAGTVNTGQELSSTGQFTYNLVSKCLSNEWFLLKIHMHMSKTKCIQQSAFTHTLTHTHIYTYYVCVCKTIIIKWSWSWEWAHPWKEHGWRNVDQKLCKYSIVCIYNIFTKKW